jgi:hypothetical protein
LGERIDNYAPNVAVVLLELALVVGVIDWFAERERAKEREPIVRLALSRARGLIVAAHSVPESVLDVYLAQGGKAGLEQAEPERSAFARGVRRPPRDLFDRIDLNADTAAMASLRRQLGLWCEDLRRRHGDAEVLIAQYAP